jgi:predicted ATPase/DNA-binding XRE family transcriptional regulator
MHAGVPSSSYARRYKEGGLDTLIMDDLSFGTWLKKRRKALNLTQEELGARLGYSGRTLEKVESGERRPSLDMAEALALALDVAQPEREAFVQYARVGLPDDLAHLASQGDNAAPWQAVWRRPNNLPPERTGFIGREELIAHILDLFERRDVRLLTLSGAPGVGKTRLSLQLGSRLLGRFRDGVFFVQLAPLRDPDQVAPAVAKALGLRETPGRPLHDQIADFLKEKDLLLILDNFEQVIDAAPLVSTLLDAARGLKVLVTSRSVLQLYGEYVFPVPPMSLPDHNDLSSLDRVERVAAFDSVRLFRERALAADPHFALSSDNAAKVGEICIQLEGLPLAIELCAARVREIPLEHLMDRLESRMDLLAGGPRDLPERQRALRAAIEWSYDLLNEEEQHAFRHLSVFVGGASEEAAYAVCCPGATPSCKSSFESLRHKSLVRQEEVAGEMRFGMLETLREYAWECLQQTGEAVEVRRRHAKCYFELALAASSELGGPAQAEWLARLEREHDNLRAALVTAREEHDYEIALRLSTALWKFWYLRGYSREGFAWVRGALELGSEAEVPLDALQNAFTAAGTLAVGSGDYALARRMHEQALEIARKVGDRKKVGDVLNNLGTVTQTVADYHDAQILYEESLEISREVDDRMGAAATLNNLGAVLLAQGEYEAAVAAEKEALALWREAGDQYGIGVSLSIMGEAERSRGNYGEALKLYRKVLKGYKELGYKRGLAYTLHNMGYAALGLGKNKEAITHFKEGLALCRELEFTEGMVMCLAGFTAALASINPSVAAELFAAVDKLIDTVKVHLDPLDSAEYKRSKQKTRDGMSDAAWGVAFQRSRSLTLDQLVESALGI